MLNFQGGGGRVFFNARQRSRRKTLPQRVDRKGGEHIPLKAKIFQGDTNGGAFQSNGQRWGRVCDQGGDFIK